MWYGNEVKESVTSDRRTPHFSSPNRPDLPTPAEKYQKSYL